MIYTSGLTSVCRMASAVLAFVFIFGQIAIAGEFNDPLDRLHAEQSQRFTPARMSKYQLVNEDLIRQKEFVDTLIHRQGVGGRDNGAVSADLDLIGPRRASVSSAPVTAAVSKQSVAAATLPPAADIADIEEAVQETIPGPDVALNEFQAGSDASYTESWLIDCGSSIPFTDPSNRVWVEDEDFYDLFRWGYAGGPSTVSSTSHTITGTDLEAIYQTYRYGGVPYKVDMPNGEYRVTLMFAETVLDAPGQRVFDVALEGNTLWHNVDIYSWAQNRQYVSMDLTTDISVSDYCLDLTFPVIYTSSLPVISGIKIEAVNVSNNAFLDFIQRKMFWFYLTETNTTTGLVKWGENNWTPGYGNVSSIASDGMALSIYTLGVERGWMAEDDAYNRTMRMFDSFDTLLDNTHGFWYHYVQMDTGDRADASEVSVVDSSLFIMGALQAGEYFKDTHPDVAVKAGSLYERMDWTWFTGISSGDASKEQFVNMGWKPETDGSYQIAAPGGGYFCNYWWDGYNESLFVDLLAVGSPTHAIDAGAWNNMSRNWVTAFGYTFMQVPPLFTHQYQQLYFDLVDKHDAFADYFLNTQLATLANRQTCAEDPRYGEDIWGLTSCGGPNGYYPYGSYPGGYHDGTVAPTAPAASMIFTPAESMSALRRIYFQYKDLVWGRHGFSDSFNADLNFRDWAANALDNGAMILGIENYRSGLIMDTFMQNQHMRSALTRVGFVSNGPVATSSIENPGLTADLAFDGNPATRWSSQWYDTPQWLEYDLGSITTFNTVTIDWEAAYAKTYRIQVSDNRINWTDIYVTVDGDGGTDELIFDAVDARYVRMYATERGTEWGYSIWEMKIDNIDYYTIHLPEVEWFAASGLYQSTGAAASLILLNYLRDGAGVSTPGQDAIYEYAKGSGLYDGSELTPDEIDRALGHYDPYDVLVSGWADTYDSLSDGNPYQGYNYSVETFDPGADADAMHDYLLDICHWISYPVTQNEWWLGGNLTARPYSPAIVPLYGAYDHWAVITGFRASGNPNPDPVTNPFNTPDVDVDGFWIYDPSVGAIGQDAYIPAADFVSLYLKPLETGDKYDGLLLQIAEPPISFR